VKTQELTGRYNDNFSYSSDHTFNYTYDKSNRLLNSVRSGSKSYMILNTYESAGNITTLKRKNNTGAITDDFNYVYYSGKNKLQRVSSVGNQFSYDANNNLIIDALNNSNEMLYDHRNLITELMHRSMIIDDTVYLTKYYYDEAGNRIRKMIYYNSNDSLLSDNIYSRDVSGRELAIYKNGSIDQWNIYGMDNIGFIDGNEDIRFYMKDHLGSIRAVTDVSGNVVSSQDGACPRMLLAGDAWGYLLENRVYDSDVSVYKFTSKERDDESKYDYFGARYYDARIGRWGQTEPLYDKYINVSPYQYGANNSIALVDVNGLENIVVVGGIDVTQNDPYKFINSGILAANDLNASGEKTTIVLLTAYLNASDIAGFQSSIGNINLVLANSSDELINYINSGTTSSSEITEQRNNDRITDLAVFGHGVEGNIDIGHDGLIGRSSVEENFSIDQAKLGNINNNAFSKSSSTILYTCNSATISSNGVNIAQVFSTSTNGSVTGYSGLVSYYNIYSGAGLSNKFNRFFTGGIGSAVNYPTEHKGSEAKTYRGGK